MITAFLGNRNKAKVWLTALSRNHRTDHKTYMHFTYTFRKAFNFSFLKLLIQRREKKNCSPMDFLLKVNLVDIYTVFFHVIEKYKIASVMLSAQHIPGNLKTATTSLYFLKMFASVMLRNNSKIK